MRQNSLDNVWDDKENDIIGNDSVLDVNEDNPVVSLNKIFMCMEYVYVILFIFIFIYFFVSVYERIINNTFLRRAMYKNQTKMYRTHPQYKY